MTKLSVAECEIAERKVFEKFAISVVEMLVVVVGSIKAAPDVTDLKRYVSSRLPPRPIWTDGGKWKKEKKDLDEG